MTSDHGPTIDFHPADPDDSRDPYDRLADLRQGCPVAHLTKPGLAPVTFVTRHDDVRTVLRDYRTFGNMGFYPALMVHEATPEPRPIIHLDPPEHTSVRRLNSLAMKPAAVEASLPHIAAVARTLVAQMVAAGTSDVVGQLAVPLPADAIAAVLGLPPEDGSMIHGWIETLFSEPVADRAPFEGLTGSELDAEFDRYLERQITARRSGELTDDDAIKRMVDYRREDGSVFTDLELRVHIRTILMAGNETTTSLISNMIYHLLAVPDAQTRLRSDRSLVEPFIEECLRYDAPLTQFPRCAKTDTSLAGVSIAKGTVVSVSMPSANRDETVWGDDAAEFRIDRFVGDHPQHLSFGLGVHLCVGAYLARKTAQLALEAVLDLSSDLELAPGFQFDNVWFFEFWRPKRLDVRFRAAR